MLMYYVYVIENELGKRYIGQTDNLKYRLARHNKDLSFSTKNRGPWKIIYTKEFCTRGESMTYEKYLKKQKGGNGFINILENSRAPA